MVSTTARPASRPLNLWVCLGVPAVAAIILLLLELTSVDMDLARLFYDPVAGDFIGRHSFFLEDILHDRAKQLVIAFSVFSIFGFIGAFFIDRLKPFKRELGCLVLSLGLATSFVTPVKAVTAVQCPWSLEQFGGHETYSELLSPRPLPINPVVAGPAGMPRPGSRCLRCSLSCGIGVRVWRVKPLSLPSRWARCFPWAGCCRARTFSRTTCGRRFSAG